MATAAAAVVTAAAAVVDIVAMLAIPPRTKPFPPFFPFFPWLISMSSPNILAGKARAAQMGITKFSQTTIASNPNRLDHAAYLSLTATPTTKASLRYDSSFTQTYAALDGEGRIFPITLPRLIPRDGDLPVIGVSTSDDMERILPGTIDPAHFDHSVVSLATLSDAVKYNFAYIPSDAHPGRGAGVGRSPTWGCGGPTNGHYPPPVGRYRCRREPLPGLCGCPKDFPDPQWPLDALGPQSPRPVTSRSNNQGCRPVSRLVQHDALPSHQQ